MKILRTMTAIVMLLAAMASAEQKQFSKPAANVPFSFNVGDQALPAGAYQVQVEGATIILTSESGQKVLALSHSIVSAAPAGKSELEFVNKGGTHQLYRVWQAGYNSGRELSLPNAEQKLAHDEANTRVAMGK